jgi:hypothetical protein
MTLFEKIMAAYPEITDREFGIFGTISLQDDSDGKGAYISKWEYSKPVPAGLKVGK